MQRRTSRNLQFAGMTAFPGTIHETVPNHLRNDTGQRFFDAIFVDSEQRRIWLFGEVGPGAEIDLSKIATNRGLSVRPWRLLGHPRFRVEERDGCLSEFACPWFDSRPSNIVPTRRFYRLSPGPAGPRDHSVSVMSSGNLR